MGAKHGNPAERLWRKVIKTDTCWIWAGAKLHNGYGAINVNGVAVRAHRLSWELSNGPIPEGKMVLHRCDQRDCVNPEHLFIGDAADNTADMRSKNRGGQNQYRAVLNAPLVGAIRYMRAAGSSGANVATTLGISHSLVSNVYTRRSWKHIE